MYELSAEQASQVSGGEIVFVTGEWKQNKAQIRALAFGIVGIMTGSAGGICACLCMGYGTAASIGGTLLSASLLGGLHYAFGYVLSGYETSQLKNDTFAYF